MELLEAAAEYSGESRNALADRLLSEGARIDRHPLIRFRSSARGRRPALLVGTRLYVHQVVATLRSEHGNVAHTATYLEIEPRLVQAAADYYAEFTAEIDEDAEIARAVEEDERERWERGQQAFA